MRKGWGMGGLGEDMVGSCIREKVRVRYGKNINGKEEESWVKVEWNEVKGKIVTGKTNLRSIA